MDHMGYTNRTNFFPSMPHQSTDTPQPNQKPIHYSYGLHSRCSSIDASCNPFPVFEDCTYPERTFCSLWRTTGFLMSLSVILELATLVGFAVVLLGGKSQRENGWKIVVPLLALCAVAQIGGMGIISYLFEKDERFFDGWRLGKSWVLCIVSWVLEVLIAGGIAFASWYMPEEDGYELIPENVRTR